MKIFSAADVARLTPYDGLVAALREGFAGRVTVPLRHHHQTSHASTLLLMPAWTEKWLGLKTLTLNSDNPGRGLPTVIASYLLIDNETGEPAAIMDGTELTGRRTACASALAASHLAREDASSLLLIGAGSLAPHFARAMAAVRPIRKIRIHNRTRSKAAALAAELAGEGFDAAVADDLPSACAGADIISCITSGRAVVLHGAWLRPGTHVDLVGAYTPDMREADAEVVARADCWVDVHETASHEAGDLLQAEAEGRYDMKRIKGDLSDLVTGRVPGRTSAQQITLFKSCGAALEDLAAAVMVHLRGA